MAKNKIIFEVEKINTLLIKKVILNSENEEEEFIMNIYRQFGFRNFEELRKWVEKFVSKSENENKLWMQEFYMSSNAEGMLLGNLLKFYDKHFHFIVSKRYEDVSLNYGARNNKIKKEIKKG